MKPWFTLALAVMLAGCAGDKPDLPADWLSIIEAEAPKAPEPPAECRTAGDPKWKRPAEGAEQAADTARRELANKQSFADMEHRRRVCAAGLVETAAKGDNDAAR